MAIRQDTVLIVDDDMTFTNFLATLIESAGYQPVTAHHADEAMGIAAETHPDVALIDVVMPGRGGYSLCRELRHHIDPTLPVMFISGERVDPMDRAAGIIAGGDDYLVKPVHPDELLARLARLLDRTRAHSLQPSVDLSEREVEILQLIAEGRRPPDVAGQLFIAPKTVSSHMQRIFTKLGVHTRAQAVAIAYEAGLIRVNGANGHARHEVEAHAFAVVD
jgi:DNA-binding NarL/FixJ family response regulator